MPEDTSLEVCTDLDTLSERLRKCTRYVDVHVYVFLADTVERLAKLYTLLPSLEDKKIVLILPNNEQSTYTLGFLMYPRFVTLMQGAYDDLNAVLTEMLRPRKS